MTSTQKKSDKNIQQSQNAFNDFNLGKKSDKNIQQSQNAFNDFNLEKKAIKTYNSLKTHSMTSTQKKKR